MARKEDHAGGGRSKKNNRTYLALMLISFSCLVCAAISCFYFIARQIRQAQPEESVSTFAVGEKKVLFISSYDAGFYSFQNQESGVEDVLSANGVDVDYYFLDSKVNDSDDYLAQCASVLKTRLLRSSRTYDVIILADDAALQFSLDYQDDLYPDVPCVFFGVTNEKLAAEAVATGKYYGYLETVDVAACVELARHFEPDATQVVAVVDNITYSGVDSRSVAEAASEYTDLNFSTINAGAISREALGVSLSKLSDDTILIYMGANRDEDGTPYTPEETTRFFLDHTQIPVFGTYELGIGDGFLGGVYMDTKSEAEEASNLALRILKAEDITPFYEMTETLPITVVDYTVMSQYGYSLKGLGSDVRVLNDPRVPISTLYPILLPALFFIISLITSMTASHLHLEETKQHAQEEKEDADRLARSQEELLYTAQHDNLTGLMDRHAVVSRIAQNVRVDSSYSIWIVDLDNFASINEAFGHATGDEILKKTAERLENFSSDHGMLTARYGGDEFLLFDAEHTCTEKSPSINELFAILRRPIHTDMNSISPCCSIGIANADGISNPEQVILNAVMAMNNAKSKGKNTFALFSDYMLEDTRKQQQIRTKVQEAVTQKAFHMVYQPKVDLATGDVCGYEALIRAKDPSLSPGTFIPIAEESGWIRQIGRQTTEMTIRQLAEWKKEGKTLHRVSINYSANQLYDAGYLDFLLDTLKQYDLSTEYIEIELTERVFFGRDNEAMRLMKAFKESGIELALDDFGTGYSSLSYLSKYPIDIIKVDKSLVDECLREGGNRQLMRDIILLSHDLGMEVVIEGVETKEQCEQLREDGADAIQGFYFSRPLPPKEAIAFTPKMEED